MRRSAPASASIAVCAIMLSQAHSAAAISASMCWIAWKRAIGPPNCRRCPAYSTDAWYARAASPSIEGQCSSRFTLMRDMPSLKPRPSPPKMFARGTRTFSKRMSASICWPDIGT
ncbi:hypothetical protein D3C85_1347720 [compost metagenome]